MATPKGRARKNLNANQAEMLQTIEQLSKSLGISPTLDEIAAASGKSIGTVRYYISFFIRNNFIRKHGNYRALQILSASESVARQ